MIVDKIIALPNTPALRCMYLFVKVMPPCIHHPPLTSIRIASDMCFHGISVEICIKLNNGLENCGSTNYRA